MAFSENFNIQVDITSDISDLQRGLAAAQTQMQKAARSMQQIGMQMSLGVTAPLAAIGATAAKTSADMQDALNEARAQADLTASEMDKIGTASEEIAATTGRSFEKIVEGMKFAIPTLEEVEASQRLVEQASKAAAEGFGSEKDLVRGTTTAVANFGKENDEAASVLNTMVDVAQDLEVGVDDLGGAFQEASKQSARAQLSIEESAAVVGTLGERLGDVQKAGRRVRTALQGLFGAKGQKLETIQRAVGGMDQLKSMIADEGLASATQTLFDQIQKQGKTVNQVFRKQTADTLTTIADASNRINELIQMNEGDSTNTINQLFKETTDVMRKFNQVVNQVRFQLNELVGEELRKDLSNALDKAKSVIKSVRNEINSLTSSQKENIIQWAGIAAAVGPALLVFGTTLTVVTSLATNIVTLGSVLLSTGALAIGLAVGINEAIDAITGFDPIAESIEGLETSLKILTDESVTLRDVIMEIRWQYRKLIRDFRKTSEMFDQSDTIQGIFDATRPETFPDFLEKSQKKNEKVVSDLFDLSFAEDPLPKDEFLKQRKKFLENNMEHQQNLREKQIDKEAAAERRKDREVDKALRKTEEGQDLVGSNKALKKELEKLRKETPGIIAQKQKSSLKSALKEAERKEQFGRASKINKQLLKAQKASEKKSRKIIGKAFNRFINNESKEKSKGSKVPQVPSTTERKLSKTQQKIKSQLEKFAKISDEFDLRGKDVSEITKKAAQKRMKTQTKSQLRSLLGKNQFQKLFGSKASGSGSSSTKTSAGQKRDVIKIPLNLDGEKVTEEVVEKIGDEVRRLNNEGRF